MLFVGYQAAGTLGREILDGAHRVRVLGNEVPVRARVATDRRLLRPRGPGRAAALGLGAERRARRAFVVHGEPEVAAHFGQTLREARGAADDRPRSRDRVALEVVSGRRERLLFQYHLD